MGWWIALWVVLGLLALVFIYDVAQRRWPIIHNFPLVGHIRYWLITIGPELRQYIVAQNREEKPFDRHERNWIETSALGTNNYFGFGTDADIVKDGHVLIKQAGFPYDPPGHTRLNTVDAPFQHGESYDVPAWKVIGERHKRRQPYRPSSIINISAMSYGSLGQNAIEALSRGAKLANCYHNTGEGGVSPYHVKGGADLVWQLGTGKFGARGADGEFSLDAVLERCQKHPQIKMIEVKLSQGAKPGKGGVLPGAKVTAEVAAIRGIPEGKDCISPNGHLEFHDAAGLIDFVESIAEKTGLPVGIKSAVGKLEFWQDLARLMKSRNEGPDYIVIDGGEGGTGAAPLTFADHVSLPLFEGFTRVYRMFLEEGIAGQITWVAAGKLGFPDKAVTAFALGADLIYVAREAMVSIGCIQAQKCHTNHCPAGVATSNWWLQRGLVPTVQAERFHRYVQTFRKEVIALTHACGYEHPNDFTTTDIEISQGAAGFVTLKERYGYEPDRTPQFRSDAATIRLTRRLVRPGDVSADVAKALAAAAPKPAGDLPKWKGGGGT